MKRIILNTNISVETWLLTLVLAVAISSTVLMARIHSFESKLDKITCATFKDRSALNLYLEKNPDQMSSLDRDKDGIACENVK